MDRVFGNFRLDVFGNIFDESCTGLFSFAKLSAAVGTAGRAVFESMSDIGRWWSSVSFVSGPGTLRR